MKTEQVNLRLESDVVEALERAAQEESLDRATMMRRLLIEALRQWRIMAALRDYQSGKISIGKAVEDSGLSHWEILELARSSSVAYPLDLETTNRRLDDMGPKSTTTSESAIPGWDGRTLPDIPPEKGGVLIVGINPALASAKAGHYYQGALGRRLWKRLDRVGLLSNAVPGAEDEALARAGHGLTDLVKRPTRSASELTLDELRQGVDGLRTKIREWQPGVVIFPFKKVADLILGPHSAVGPGPTFEGAPTFVLSGPYARHEEAERVDAQLRRLLRGIGL